MWQRTQQKLLALMPPREREGKDTSKITCKFVSANNECHENNKAEKCGRVKVIVLLEVVIREDL